MKGPAELEFSLLSRGSFPAASDTLRRQKCGPVNLGLRTLRRDTSQLLPLRYLGIMKQVGDRDYCYPRLLLATQSTYKNLVLSLFLYCPLLVMPNRQRRKVLQGPTYLYHHKGQKDFDWKDSSLITSMLILNGKI